MNKKQSHTAINSPLLKKLSGENSIPSNLYNKYISAEELLNDIRHNLENILNTRKTPIPYADRYPELSQSIFNFGLLDCTQSNINSESFHHHLCHQVKEAITYFEPRLEAINVTTIENHNNRQHPFKIRISANIKLAVSDQKTLFETQYKPRNYCFEIG